MLQYILGVGIFFFFLLAGFWQLLWHSDISSFGDIFSSEELKVFFTGLFDLSKTKVHMSPYESGVFFSVFVMMQFWNLFNVRYFRTERSILSDLIEVLSGKRKFSDCFSRGFLIIAAVILFGQILIVNLAGDFFEVAPLFGRDWIQIVLVTSPVLFIPDLIRTIRHWWRA